MLNWGSKTRQVDQTAHGGKKERMNVWRVPNESLAPITDRPESLPWLICRKGSSRQMANTIADARCVIRGETFIYDRFPTTDLRSCPEAKGLVIMNQQGSWQCGDVEEAAALDVGYRKGSQATLHFHYSFFLTQSSAFHLHPKCRLKCKYKQRIAFQR